jgi:hypothetical protein
MQSHIPKLTGIKESSAKMEVYGNECLYQKSRKISSKQPTNASHRLRKARTNQTQI